MAITLIIGQIPLSQGSYHTSSARAEEARTAAEFARTQAREVTIRHIERTGNTRAAEELLRQDPVAPPPRRERAKRVCQLERLEAQGSLRPEHVRAGQEVARVYFDLTAALHARTTASYEEHLPGGLGGDWPAVIRADVRDRYAAWCDWSGQRLARPGLTLTGMTIEVVAENLGPRQAANRLGMDQRTLMSRLRLSLFTYAEMAGWVGVQTPSELMVEQEAA